MQINRSNTRINVNYLWIRTHTKFNQFYRRVASTCTAYVHWSGWGSGLWTYLWGSFLIWASGGRGGPPEWQVGLGPGGDSDISEGLPGEPLSPLTHTHSRGPSACPAPAMSPCLLGCVVFCLLQAGESRGQGPLRGASTKPVRCDCSMGPPSPQGRSLWSLNFTSS